MYTYTPQFNDDKQRAGGVLFPLKTTGAETHFIWIWMTVLCRHDLIFQLLVYFFTLTIFHLEHLTSDQTKARKIASLAWGVVGAVYPSAHWYRWSIKRKHLCNSEIGRDRLSFRWIMVLPSRQNSNYISIVHECTSDNVPFKCHILQMTRFYVSYTAGRPGAVWNVRSKNKHYYRKSINTAKNRIESENLILFFKCWFLLIKYLNLNFFIDYHTSALCEQKLKDQKWNLLLFLIFFYVVELKMQISIKYRLKWLNLPK